MSYIQALKCRECGQEFEPIKIHACENCFGPLEAEYDLDAIHLDRTQLSGRPKSLWRYSELLPLKDKTKIVDIGAGFTRLIKADRLAEALGIKKLWIKDDTENPTGSFKDRPATVAVSKALELGYKAVGCASTGNLAAATAAHAAKAGLPCYIFIPANIESNKILQASIFGSNIIAVNGTYDEANRLAAQAADEYDWALVNINVRSYYVEGSKTLAFETLEQLGWRAPDNIVIPMGSGALLCAIDRGLKQFRDLGLIDSLNTKIVGAQPQGCSPISSAFKANSEDYVPVENPDTIAKSLAIGDPGDGVYALKAIRESKGTADYASDAEILEGIKLLAKTEGVFSEPAGGVTVAVLKKLVEAGQVSRDEETVLCITGSGFKSADTLLKTVKKPVVIEPSIEEIRRIVQ